MTSEGGCGPPPLSTLLLWLAIAVLGVAPLQGALDAAPAADNVYHRPLGNDPGSLDPARIRNIYSLAVVGQIFDGLVQFDQTLTVTPALAHFWTASRDGLVWTFTLRKGVKFHDGRELTADDVVYSLTRLLDPKVDSAVAGLFNNIKGAVEFRGGKAAHVSGLVALDRHVVQVTLTDAPVPFVSVLAVGHAKILPKHVVERAGDAFAAHPVGTGPFTFRRWERGREIVLDANPEYFGGAPRLSRIAYRIFPGEQVDAMYEEFRKGSLEDTPIPSRHYSALVADKTYLHVKRPMLSVRFYGIDARMKPLDDRRIRKALIHAIDREALVEEVFSGRHAVARGILPPGTLGFNPSLKGYAFDPPRARELLKEAGYPGGRGLAPIIIWSGTRGEDFVRAHERIKHYLEAVGVQVEFRYETHWPTYSRMFMEGKLPIYMHAWYADVPDPDNFLFRLFYSRSPQNYLAYANRAVDDLVLHARRETDLQRRVDLYRRAEQLVLDDAPIIPLFHHTYERLFQPYVRSVEVNGLGDPYIPLRKIWLDRPMRAGEPR